MPARLIVNADDFGLTPGINRAIAELHAAAVLSSATLMASGPAFEDAVAIARAHPRLGVGAHIVLTDGVPASAPHTIPTLLGPDRRTLRPTLSGFIADLLRGHISEDDIYRETLAQLRKLRAAGIHPTHVDTHKHTHVFPRVARPVLRAAAEAGVRAIRNPFEPPGAAALTHSSTPVLRRLQLRALATLEPAFRRTLATQPGLRTTSGTFGISATGSLHRETLRILLDAVSAAPDGSTFELCCHPGYNTPDLDRVVTRLREHREIERDALLLEIPRTLGEPQGLQLIGYAEL